jgi:hypothetical protein
MRAAPRSRIEVLRQSPVGVPTNPSVPQRASPVLSPRRKAREKIGSPGGRLV